MLRPFPFSKRRNVRSGPRAEGSPQPPRDAIESTWQGLQALEPRLLRSGSIMGHVFEDLNQNGLHDPNEVGIHAYILNLRDAEDNVTVGITGVMDLNGNGGIEQRSRNHWPLGNAQQRLADARSLEVSTTLSRPCASQLTIQYGEPPRLIIRGVISGCNCDRRGQGPSEMIREDREVNEIHVTEVLARQLSERTVQKDQKHCLSQVNSGIL